MIKDYFCYTPHVVSAHKHFTVNIRNYKSSQSTLPSEAKWSWPLSVFGQETWENWGHIPKVYLHTTYNVLVNG